MEKHVFRQTEKTLRCSSITPNRRFNGSTASVRERQEPGEGEGVIVSNCMAIGESQKNELL